MKSVIVFCVLLSSLVSANEMEFKFQGEYVGQCRDSRAYLFARAKEESISKAKEFCRRSYNLKAILLEDFVIISERFSCWTDPFMIVQGVFKCANPSFNTNVF